MNRQALEALAVALETAPIPADQFDMNRWSDDKLDRDACGFAGCSAAVKLRASGRWWTNQSFGPQDHAPEHIIPPCRRHAWQYLVWLDPDRHLVGCACQTERPHR